MKSGRFGRGAGAARVAQGSAGNGARHRRVVVKARFVKLAGKGVQAAAAHLRYLQRDGVTREGEKGELYGRELDRVDAKAFIGESQDDRHQFRFVVAPEDGAQYETLRPLVRKVMSQMEQDLGTRLDWVAVDHFNTGHPHAHIVLRGRDDQGKDLVIAREYLSDGFRARVQAQVTLDLGPRSDLEIAATRQAEVSQERLTGLDRQLLREAGDDGMVSAAHRDPFIHTARTERLVQLERFGLADQTEDGRWRLKSEMEAILRQMGERGDIIKALHATLRRHDLEPALADSQIHDAQGQMTGQGGSIVGRLIDRGLAEEMTDRHYLVVDGIDGRVHYVDIGAGERTAPLPANGIVRLTPNRPDLRPADQVIADVAAANDGFYSVEAHLKFDPSARQAFAETHARRLEAIRRVTGGVTREADGRFVIGPDYAEKALDFEVREARRSPTRVEVLSDMPITQQVDHNGKTWLDKELAAGGSEGASHAGFGEAVRGAMQARMQWLIAEGLAVTLPLESGALHQDALGILHRREMTSVAATLSKAIGLQYAEAHPGETIEGTLRKAVTIGTDKYAVVDRGRDFTLVPWRPVLERHIDKSVSGIMRERGINWTIGRTRGPEVT